MGAHFFNSLLRTATMRTFATLFACLVAAASSVPYSTSSSDSSPVKAASPYYTPPVYSEVHPGYVHYPAPSHVHYGIYINSGYNYHGYNNYYGNTHPFYQGLLRKNNEE